MEKNTMANFVRNVRREYFSIRLKLTCKFLEVISVFTNLEAPPVAAFHVRATTTHKRVMPSLEIASANTTPPVLIAVNVQEDTMGMRWTANRIRAKAVIVQTEVLV